MPELSRIIERIRAAHPSLIGEPVVHFGQSCYDVDAAHIPELLRFLRDDEELQFNMLVDMVGIDYSAYPGHTLGRFGVVFHLKSFSTGVRLSLRTLLSESQPEMPTVSNLYKNANWLEREIYDQYGVIFNGHPNLKRLLNHHEFVGHPLRKDYPITRRQWLSESDTLSDELDQRLKEKGYV